MSIILGPSYSMAGIASPSPSPSPSPPLVGSQSVSVPKAMHKINYLTI